MAAADPFFKFYTHARHELMRSQTWMNNLAHDSFVAIKKQIIHVKKIMFVFGTRPEAIKMAPLILELRKFPKVFQTIVCVTAQHRHMLDQVLDFFSIVPDYDLDVMIPNQILTGITTSCLSRLAEVLTDTTPDLVFVQGDTTTAFAGALAAAMQKIKVAHLEAGLRSGDKDTPFPEEMNRSMIARMSDFHFAPTQLCKQNLLAEQVKQEIYVVGNTVIDSLLLGQKLLKSGVYFIPRKLAGLINPSSRSILVTSHRRESFGKPLEDICMALLNIVNEHPDTEIIFPIHPNPQVQQIVKRLLGNNKQIHLLEPLSYVDLIWIMEKCHLVLTDSGGIQEEAPSLGKPVVVLREVTERQEGVDNGNAILVGTDQDKIFNTVSLLLRDQAFYESMSTKLNPYGDGTTSMQIAEILMKKHFFPMSKPDLNLMYA